MLKASQEYKCYRGYGESSCSGHFKRTGERYTSLIICTTYISSLKHSLWCKFSLLEKEEALLDDSQESTDEEEMESSK